MKIDLQLIKSTRYPDPYCGYDKGCKEVGDNFLSFFVWIFIILTISKITKYV